MTTDGWWKLAQQQTLPFFCITANKRIVYERVSVNWTVLIVLYLYGNNCLYVSTSMFFFLFTLKSIKKKHFSNKNIFEKAWFNKSQ